jgi:hypothetical protein
MSDRQIVVLVLGINSVFLTAIFGFIGVRLLSGFSPVPAGYTPLVLGAAVIVPISCIGLGNFLRLHWNA